MSTPSIKLNGVPVGTIGTASPAPCPTSASLCEVNTPAECVVYTGDALTSIPITSQTNLKVALQRINAKFLGLQVNGIEGPQGPAGPAGPAGPQGNAGPQGMPGPAGSSENETITLSGDIVTASGKTGINVVLKDVATAGSYNTVTVNAKGQVTSGSNVAYLTTFAIANATDVSTTNVASGDLLRYDGGISKWTKFTPNYLTQNNPIVLSGDATGTSVHVTSPGAQSNLTLTLATVLSTPGTYGSASKIPVFTVDAKGRITAVSEQSVTIVSTLAGLSDVALTSPVTNQLLRYNTATSKWENFTPAYISANQTITLGISGDMTASASGTTVLSATDALVTGLRGKALPTLATGYLKYNGTAWVFDTPAAGGGGTISVTLVGDVTGTGETTVTTALSNTGVAAGTYSSVTVDTKGRVTAATNPGYLTEITSSQVTTALGFTPYSDANPNSYTANLGTVISVGGTGTVSGLTLSGTVTESGNLTLGGTLALTSANVTDALGFTPYNETNPDDYITGITAVMVTDALGYTPEDVAKKGVADGYASLDATGKVPSTQLPSYVDDVLEYADLASFPASGATGKIFVDIATGKIYRWSGTVYVEISPSAAPAWGGITGTLANQEDLQAVLDAKQALDGDLTAIAALSGTSGLLKKTAANTWTLDTTTYLSAVPSLQQVCTVGSTYTGDITAARFFESSDIRFKTVLETSPNIDLSGIEVIKYTRDGQTDIRYGYSAQQVQSVLPDLVLELPDQLVVNYSDVHTLKIAQLEKRIAELESKLGI